MQQKKYQKLKENGWLVIRIVLGFISSYGTRQKKSYDFQLWFVDATKTLSSGDHSRLLGD